MMPYSSLEEGNGSNNHLHQVDDDGELERGASTPLRRALRVCARYRAAEVAFLLIMLSWSSNQTGKYFQHHMFLPQVTAVSSSGEHVVGNNTAFSSAIYECIHADVKGSGGGSSSSPCCEAMKNHAPAYETVPTSLLIVVAALGIALLLLRQVALLILTTPPPKAQDSSSSSSSSSLRDLLVGYMYSVVLTGATTNMLKSLGVPRPNHFALVLYGTYLLGSGDKSAESMGKGYVSGSWKSFPSGHSSMSMCTMLFVSLVLLQDVRRGVFPLTAQLRAVYVSLALIPVYVSLFIAATRVADYWHAVQDVLGGLVVGAAWAVLSHYHVTPDNAVVVKPNARLTKYF